MSNENGTVVPRVWAFFDNRGRLLIGRVGDIDNPIVLIKEPLVILEQVARQGDAVNFGFAPILHSFPVQSISVKWDSHFEPDNNLRIEYEKIINTIRAKRSGIELASSIPKKLEVVKN